MADKTPPELTASTTLGDTDLLLTYPLAGSVLKKMAASVLVARILTALGGTYAAVANNLSDLASAATARANLGLGTAATLASSAVYQVANNLSEIGSAAAARTNLGAAAADQAVLTGGVTFTGSTKQNVQAVAGVSIDVSVAEFFTKSISANTTFTFDNPTASKGQAFVMKLTISSAAVPTWPATVKWAAGVAPTLGNGAHDLGFFTFDGGTVWTGILIAFAEA